MKIAFSLRSLCLASAFALGLSSATPTAFAADWSQWRGPDRSDRSPDTGLLKQWPAGGPKRLWLNENAGLGYAGYSIVGDKLFTLGLRGDQELLIALDAKTGKELWASPAGAKYPNGWGDGPRATPTVEGDFVYAMGGQGTLICAQTRDGKVVWQKSMTADLGGKRQDWGYTESVLIAGNTVICTPGGPEGTLAALDKKSGAVVWRTKELTDNAQYSSPILVQHAGKPQVIQLVMKKYFGVDPADGKVLWTQEFAPGRVAVIPTPIYHGGQVYITAGYGAGCSSVTLDNANKVTPAYSNKVMKNHHGGVILVGEYLYGHGDAGWVCQNFKTGEEVWNHRGFGKGAVHYADGMLYCLAEDSGEVALVEASPKGWTEHGRFKIEPQTKQRNPQGRVWTHPVVVNGRLYLRDQELLFCYDVKG
jgi:outer membrane protein assembly factor BamB